MCGIFDHKVASLNGSPDTHPRRKCPSVGKATQSDFMYVLHRARGDMKNQ